MRIDNRISRGRATAGPARFAFAALLVLLLAGRAAAALPAAADGRPLPSLAPMLERVTPAVVNISTRSRTAERGRSPMLSDPVFRYFFGEPPPRSRSIRSLGSGVIVDADRGLLLTNHHVIEDAEVIEVVLADGRRYHAELVGSDPPSDIAVLKIPAEDGLQALPLADTDDLRVGDFVVAIGNPFGLGQTVTSGIVSALGRTGLGIEGYEDFIQTDASINPGNSGGALVNLAGELVGINTAIFGPSQGNVGIGFAIPANMAREIMTQIVDYGGMSRGGIGIAVQDLTPDLARAFGLDSRQGVLITEVRRGSQAERDGLRVGDLLMAIDDRPVDSAAEVRNRVGVLRRGDAVRLKLLRDGRPLEIETELQPPRLSELEAGRLDARLGGALLVEAAQRGHLPVPGVRVHGVDPGSRAWRLGLRPGDLLLRLNRRPVEGLSSLSRLLGSGSGGSGPLLLQVRRGDKSILLLAE